MNHLCYNFNRMQNLVGQSIGRYHILEQLGEGGMATVYKAFDTRLERQVAIKVIRREAFSQEVVGQVLARFEREAKALAQLSHPNIVKVYDYGEHEGSPFLVMEYVPGGTLKTLTGSAMPWREAARFLLPVARALIYAHAEKIVHRDIKPGNILITSSGEPLLSDFGIAKMLEKAEGMTLTGTGVGIGTPEYMAPEQGMGKGVDGRSDVYALGVVLYELVTGRRPYEADTPLAVLLKHMTDPLPRPKLYIKDLPDELEWVLLKALAKEPAERYPDMAAFAAALESVVALEPSTVGKKASPNRPMAVTIPEAPSGVSRATALSAAGSVPAVSLPAVKPRRWGWLAFALAGAGVLCVLGIGIVWAVSNSGILGPSRTATAQPTSVAEVAASPVLAATLTAPAPTSTGIAVTPTLQPATETIAPALATSTLDLSENDELLVNPADQSTMIWIPSDSFEMGATREQADYLIGFCASCDPQTFYDAQPVHTVQLDGYWIYKTEISNAMYASCVRAGSCSPPRKYNSESRSDYYSNPTYDDYPVVFVNWNAAEQYCRWAGGRLPTEAEWEYAARGKTGWLYPWGNQVPDRNLANVDNLIGDTTPVENYPQGASVFGLLNMTGNVWEWVSDWYQKDYYSSMSAWTNPRGPTQAVTPVRKSGRGGAYWISLGMSSVAMRDWYEPEKDGSAVGFRCVLENNP